MKISDDKVSVTHIPLRDGELRWYPGYLDRTEAQRLFLLLKKRIEWRQDYLYIAGRTLPIPRLQAWYGEKGYAYSGLALPPNSMLPEMKELAGVLEELLGMPFNSVLANLYRDGNDSVGWHSDDEPELGVNPCIASLSLGADRRFQLRHKRDSSQRLSLDLTHGSLLVMGAQTQHHWRHQLAKTRRQVGARINLTFRYIVSTQ